MIVTQPDRVLLFRQIARHAPMLTGAILDIGGGEIRRYQRVCTNGTSYRTLDMNASWKPDIVGSAEAIPLADASVDGILCTQVLEHVPHPWIAVREMYRVLRSGGRCLITVPQMNELHEEPHDYYRYTRFGLHTLLEDAGFIVETVDQRGKYFSVKTQIVIRRLIDRWKPYDHRVAMLILAPLTAVLTRIAMLRDRHSSDEASTKHAIGWLIVGRKA